MDRVQDTQQRCMRNTSPTNKRAKAGRIANLAWLRSGAEVLDDIEAPAGSSEDHANENRPNSSPASTSSDSQLPPPLNTEAEWYKGLGDDDEAQYKRQKLLGQQRLCVLIEHTLHGQVQIVELLTKLARDGARNYRSEAAKLTAAELLIHWSGLNKPYTSNNIKDLDKCYDYDVGHAMLEDDKYRVGLTGTDPFGCEDYRKILYATFPLSRTDLARLSNPAQRFFPHNSIHHMTPHMIAFADAKIRSMLKGEASRPKQASDEEITTMGEMVQGLQDGTLDSQYVVPRMSLEPFTPAGQML
ncbi:TPA: hypothetical protein ACH3X1_007145 [Trebouxia sp. C0004]